MKDPAFDKGALGDRFAAGVFGAELFEHEHERDTADHLAAQGGWNVHVRRPVLTDDVKNPDVMVRTDRVDPGRVTEFKRLNSDSLNAVRKRLWESAGQVNQWGGGDVVIDGRGVGVSEDLARRRVHEAVAEARRKGKALPSHIHVILGNGAIITMRGT